jgi:Cu+-exporting ATPase
MLTGESEPVAKSAGDRVIGATLNQSGALVLRAERVGAESALARIVQLVAEAQRSRAPVQRLADLVSGWFVPAVLLVALTAGAAWLLAGPEPRFSHALTAAVGVLIIACPCALGLATPVAITVGVGRAAKEGVLFRHAEALERLGRTEVLFLDKTGTLTEGRPAVVGVFPEPAITADQLLQLAAAVEQHSEHPWAQAIVRHANARGQSLSYAVRDFQMVAGQGAQAQVSETGAEPWGAVRVGRPEWAAAQVSSTTTAARSVVGVSRDGRWLGRIELADALRSTAVAACTDLQQLGLHLVMLTGDRQPVAETVAREVGIREFHAGLQPAEKLHWIEQSKQQGRTTAMAGDGINDAPALAAADVGISLGGGTDVARQTAGVVLLSADLRGLPRAVRLSRATLTTIRQNLWFAFLYNGLGIPLAAGALYPLAGVLLDPMLAALAMSLSSVSVLANSLRLKRARLR